MTSTELDSYQIHINGLNFFLIKTCICTRKLELLYINSSLAFNLGSLDKLMSTRSPIVMNVSLEVGVGLHFYHLRASVALEPYVL